MCSTAHFKAFLNVFKLVVIRQPTLGMFGSRYHGFLRWIGTRLGWVRQFIMGMFGFSFLDLPQWLENIFSRSAEALVDQRTETSVGKRAKDSVEQRAEVPV